MAAAGPLVEELRGALASVSMRNEGGVLVVAPGSTDEVAGALRYCDERGIAVEISGARTKRGWVGPCIADVVLETTRLSGVCEHPWQDLTATVGAGTRWAEMQRLLAQHGQMVALDPLWPERATVGGVLSANDSGALRGRYGSARDLVIGMTLVLADGTIAKTGGKVVKNVAGYDLHKLMIGAWGTLAVMTEVTFRLHPFAGARAVHSFHAERAELLMEFARTVCAEHLNPEALQVRTAEAGYVLDVQLVGSEAGIAAKNEHMREVASSCRVEQLPVFPAGVFAAREQMVADAGATRVKATMPPSALPEALVAVRTAGGSAVAYPTGILYAKFANGVEVPAGLERCVRETNGGVTVLGQPVAYTPLMREIKRQFDARDTLNRGFVGGM